jgi:hypothetical protein
MFAWNYEDVPEEQSGVILSSTTPMQSILSFSYPEMTLQQP